MQLLHTMYLHSNSITGTLPEVWGVGMSNMQRLWLYGNSLSGTLPSSWSEMTLVEELSLGSNTIGGTLPPTWSSMTALRDLFYITGSPTEWSSWISLEYLRVWSNRITGSLPASWSAMMSLTTLELQQNQISGSLPPEWAALGNVSAMDLSDNRLSGSLPADWANMSALTTIVLRNNLLTGMLPGSWGALRFVTTMDLSQNILQGSLPVLWATYNALFSLVNKLTLLNISNNCLEAVIPQQWTQRFQFFSLTINNCHTRVFLSQNTTASLRVLCRGRWPAHCDSASVSLNMSQSPDVLPARATAIVSNSKSVMPQLLSTSLSSSATLFKLNGAEVSKTNVEHQRHSVDAVSVAGASTGTTVYATLIGSSIATVLARGSVPALQRASASLVLSAMCRSNTGDEVLFESYSDKPTQLHFDIAGEPQSYSYALGATVGNTVVVLVLTTAAHLLNLRSRYYNSSQGFPTFLQRTLANILHPSPLPGALALPYGVLVVPTVSACAVLVSAGSNTLAFCTAQSSFAFRTCAYFNRRCSEAARCGQLRLLLPFLRPTEVWVRHSNINSTFDSAVVVPLAREIATLDCVLALDVQAHNVTFSPRNHRTLVSVSNQPLLLLTISIKLTVRACKIVLQDASYQVLAIVANTTAVNSMIQLINTEIVQQWTPYVESKYNFSSRTVYFTEIAPVSIIQLGSVRNSTIEVTSCNVTVVQVSTTSRFVHSPAALLFSVVGLLVDSSISIRNSSFVVVRNSSSGSSFELSAPLLNLSGVGGVVSLHDSLFVNIVSIAWRQVILAKNVINTSTTLTQNTVCIVSGIILGAASIVAIADRTRACYAAALGMERDCTQRNAAADVTAAIEATTNPL